MNHPSLPNISSLPDISLIRQRAQLLRQLRRFFDQRGFLEVQPPCLSRDCVVDAYIDPITVDSSQLRIAQELPDKLFLQTSPELAMKRMLAAGAPSIYSIGPVFRSGESGDWHNVEFTMLEWYDVGADMDAEVQLLGELACQILGADGYGVRPYREVFRDHVSFDPIDAPIETLREHVHSLDAQLSHSLGTERDSMLDVILSQQIQPRLGTERPLIITHYPLSQAALARPSAADPQCAARFELFYHGVELANGYDELLDADVLITRSRQHNHVRAQTSRDRLPEESSLLAAMRVGLPPCAGVALGVDRLLMVRSGETSLQHVMPFRTKNS